MAMLVALGLSLPGLAFLLLLVVALERFGLWLTGVSWLPWRRRRTGMPVSAAAFTTFDLALAPSKEIELAQERSEAMLRDDEAQGAPPRGRVDLDAGVVWLSRPENSTDT